MRGTATQRYLTLCLFSGRKSATFHQASQICCGPSFNMPNLSGKLYLTSCSLGSWHIQGHVSDTVGWCQCSGPSSPLCCSGFRPRHGAMHRWLGRWFSLKHRKSHYLYCWPAPGIFSKPPDLLFCFGNALVAVCFIADGEKFLVVTHGERELIRNHHLLFFRISIQLHSCHSVELLENIVQCAG